MGRTPVDNVTEPDEYVSLYAPTVELQLRKRTTGWRAFPVKALIPQWDPISDAPRFFGQRFTGLKSSSSSARAAVLRLDSTDWC